MDKAKNALDFYVLCNRLKTIKRTGWIKWKVRGRKESIGDHVYGAQMLAYAMKYSYPEEFKNINIDRVIMMLSIHELGEIIIGDLTPFQTSAQEKHEREVAAVKEVLSYIGCPPELFDLWLEFENRTTEDAWFAYFCDKCECDIQSKIYDEERRVNLKKLASNESTNDVKVKELLEDAKKCPYPWSTMWIKYGLEKYGYSEPFKEVSNYCLTHKILPKKKK